MKIHRSLIDPHSVFIENDDEPSINYSGGGPAQHIEPLALPVLSLSQKPSGAPARGRQEPAFTCVGDQVVANLPVAAPAAHTNSAVEALPLPTMNFDPPGSKKTAPAPARNAPANGVEPLPMPTMTF